MLKRVILCIDNECRGKASDSSIAAPPPPLQDVLPLPKPKPSKAPRIELGKAAKQRARDHSVKKQDVVVKKRQMVPEHAVRRAVQETETAVTAPPATPKRARLSGKTSSTLQWVHASPICLPQSPCHSLDEVNKPKTTRPGPQGSPSQASICGTNDYTSNDLEKKCDAMCALLERLVSDNLDMKLKIEIAKGLFTHKQVNQFRQEYCSSSTRQLLFGSRSFQVKHVNSRPSLSSLAEACVMWDSAGKLESERQSERVRGA